jgi:hypothetical protein
MACFWFDLSKGESANPRIIVARADPTAAGRSRSPACGTSEIDLPATPGDNFPTNGSR